MKAGLKALKVLGVTGIAVDIWWGLVEKSEPGVYDWKGYKQLLQLVRDLGFKLKVRLLDYGASSEDTASQAHKVHGVVQVNLCFCSSDAVSLPEWILDEGNTNPEIFYTDKAGQRSMDCLTLGVDDGEYANIRTMIHECTYQHYSDHKTFFPLFCSAGVQGSLSCAAVHSLHAVLQA